MEKKWVSIGKDLKKIRRELNSLNDNLYRNKEELDRLQSRLDYVTNELLKLRPMLEEAEGNYADLQLQCEDAEKRLSELEPEVDDDEILDLKFIIKKLQKERIPPASDEVNALRKREESLKSKIDGLETRMTSLEEKRGPLEEKKASLEEEISRLEELFEKAKREEEYRRDRLYKRLYVDFDDDVLSEIFRHFNMNESSVDENLKLLAENHSQEEIYDFVERSRIINNKINELIESEETYRCFIITHIDDLSKISPFSMETPDLMDRVMNFYSVRSIVEGLFDLDPDIIISDNSQPKSLEELGLRVCPKCRRYLPRMSVKCKFCNRRLVKMNVVTREEGGMWCDNCFTDIPGNSEYCPFCGSINVKLKSKMNKNPKPVPKPKAKPVPKPKAKPVPKPKAKPKNPNKRECPHCGYLNSLIFVKCWKCGERLK